MAAAAAFSAFLLKVVVCCVLAICLWRLIDRWPLQ